MRFERQYPLVYSWGKERGRELIEQWKNQPDILSKMPGEYLSEIENLKRELEDGNLTDAERLHKVASGAFKEGILSCFD